MLGQAFPPEEGIPYSALSSAFLPMLRETSPDRLAVLTRGGGAELAVFFPGFQHGDGEMHASHHADPAEFRVRFFWAFAEFLRGLASREPLFVLLEDLQWADASSLELLHFLIRNTADCPVRFLVTYTDEYVQESSLLQRMLMSLSANGMLQSVHLVPFSSAETRAFVSALFEVPEKAIATFAPRIQTWTGGNAFFLVETLRSLVESGKIHQQNDTWLGWDSEDWEVPASIREAVAGRVARCSEAAQAVSNVMAVAADPLPFPLLTELSEGPKAAIVSALEELVNRGIVREEEAEGAIIYRFDHPLLQQCLYDEIGLARRRALHQAVADALMHQVKLDSAGTAEALAYHYLRAGTGDSDVRALPHLVTAGRQALDRHADAQATSYLEKALAILRSLEDQPVPPIGVPEVLKLLGTALQRRGRYEEALAVWKELRDDESVTGSPDQTADILRRMALACFWSGRHPEALVYFQTATETLRAPPAVVARVRLGFGVCLQDIGR